MHHRTLSKLTTLFAYMMVHLALCFLFGEFPVNGSLNLTGHYMPTEGFKGREMCFQSSPLCLRISWNCDEKKIMWILTVKDRRALPNSLRRIIMYSPVVGRSMCQLQDSQYGSGKCGCSERRARLSLGESHDISVGISAVVYRDEVCLQESLPHAYDVTNLNWCSWIVACNNY